MLGSEKEGWAVGEQEGWPPLTNPWDKVIKTKWGKQHGTVCSALHKYMKSYDRKEKADTAVRDEHHVKE